MELKCVSERKQGKEGSVVNCIACSLTSITLGMRLRLKGDTQENNVIQIMANLPSIGKPSHSTTVSFDRGYGKFKFLQNISKLNYNVIKIAPTFGYHHPFVLQSKVDIYCTKWQKKGLTENQIEKMIDVF